VVTDRAGKVTGFFLRGSVFACGEVSFESGVAVSASVAYTDEGVEIEVDAPEEIDVSVYVASRPAAVCVDDKVVEGWTYDTASCRMNLSLPQGHTVLMVR